MSATARATATRPVTPRTPHTTTRRRPALRPVPPPAPNVAGNGMFAVIVAAMLLGGMVALLVLNTTLAQGAFEIGSLTKVSRDLAVNEQRLLQKVAHAESPESLQSRADELGMVPASSPVFLRLADRKVLGEPAPAVTTAKVPAASKPATTGTTAVSGAAAPAKPKTGSGSPATSGAAATSMSDEAVPDAPTGPPVTSGSDAAQPDAGTTP